MDGSTLSGSKATASFSKLQSSDNILPPGTFRLSIPTGEKSIDISAQSTAGELQAAIRSISNVMEAVTVADSINGSTFRAWDITFRSLKYVTNVPFLNVLSFSNGTSLRSVTASIQSIGASIPLYDLHSNETLKLYWKNTSMGIFPVNFTEVKFADKLIGSGLFAYAKVEKTVIRGFGHTLIALVPHSFMTSNINLDNFNKQLLSYEYLPTALRSSAKLLQPQFPVKYLNATVSFTLQDTACLESNGGVRCDPFEEELSPPINLPMSAEALASNLETLRDITTVNVSFTSLNGLRNDNGEFVLQGVKYSITFIAITANSTATAVTASNEFTWSPVRNSIRFAGATERIYDIPALSVVPYISSGSGRRLAAGSNVGSLISSGWGSAVKVKKNGRPASLSNNVSIDVSTNGQDYSSSGSIVTCRYLYKQIFSSLIFQIIFFRTNVQLPK